jgi:hypothetical protein
MSRFIYCYAECHYAERRYAECRYAECRYPECRFAECRGADLIKPFFGLNLLTMFCKLDRLKTKCNTCSISMKKI